MPTYEYRCRDCGHTFDVWQKMTDDALTACPQCGGQLRKVFAPPAISFKGSGFYATDHGKKKPESSDDGKAGEPGRTGEGKTATKKDATAATSGSKSDTTSSTTTTTKKESSS